MYDVTLITMSTSSTQTIPTRIFGKTEEQVPVYGLGTGEGGMGLPNKEAIRLYRRAVELGVTYIDTAPGYENAQVQLAEVIRGIRDQLFLTSKVPTPDGKTFREGIENNLKDLGTDYLDLAFIHSVGSQDIDELLSPKGSLQALLDLKERGLARYIGFTAHNRPGNAVRVLEQCDQLDAVMLAMNFIERNVYGFEDRVLPIARAQGLGVAAMKVFGGAPEMEYNAPVKSAMEVKGGYDLEKAFRYSLGLPGVALNVIGVYTEEELEQNIRWAREFSPLSPAESEELDTVGQKAAEKWGQRYGEVE